MDQCRQVHGMLWVAARLLGDAAGQLRGTGIAAPEVHLKAMAHALWNVQETMRANADIRPDLLALLDASSPEKQYLDAWRDQHLPTIYQLVEAGELVVAVEMLTRLAIDAGTETDRRIALHEIAHLIGVYA